MKGGKIVDDMCPMLGFNISSIVPVGFMKTVKFYTFLTRNIKNLSISLWNNFVNIDLIFFSCIAKSKMEHFVYLASLNITKLKTK